MSTSLYVTYLRTMQDSPEVAILQATTDWKRSRKKMAAAKKLEQEWMSSFDEESGDWAEAVTRKFYYPYTVAPGDTLYAVVETCWYEDVSTDIWLFASEAEAKEYIVRRSAFLKGQNAFLVEDDGDPMHLADDSAMADYYFGVETLFIE